MADATKNEPSQKTPEGSGGIGLPMASLLGSAYMLLAVATVFYGVSSLWRISGIDTQLTNATNSATSLAARIVVQILAAGLLFGLGRMLAGSHPRHGLRGGLFLGMSVWISAYFLSRAVAINHGAGGPNWMRVISDPTTGLIAWAILAVIFLVLGHRFLSSERGRKLAVTLEDQGWFTPKPHKRTQGHLVRRLTILGVIIITWSGVYALSESNWFTKLPENWRTSIPYSAVTVPELSADELRYERTFGVPVQGVVLLPDVKYTVPLLLLGLSVWFAYRLVHVPTFGDFLIATEAEINKVSWSSRRALIRDTIVVLVTVVLMASFLFVIDAFWGWLLSRSFIGVLPSDAEERMIVIDPGTVVNEDEETLKYNQRLTGAQVEDWRKKTNGATFVVKPANEADLGDERQVKW